MRSRWVVGVVAVCLFGSIWGNAGAHAAPVTGRWVAVPGATTAPTNRTIEGIAVIAANDVWAVGRESAVVARGIQGIPNTTPHPKTV